jgi:hypothetical protein
MRVPACSRRPVGGAWAGSSDQSAAVFERDYTALRTAERLQEAGVDSRPLTIIRPLRERAIQHRRQNNSPPHSKRGKERLKTNQEIPEKGEGAHGRGDYCAESGKSQMAQFVDGDIRAVHLAFDLQQIACYDGCSVVKHFILITSSVMLMPIPLRGSNIRHGVLIPMGQIAVGRLPWHRFCPLRRLSK